MKLLPRLRQSARVWIAKQVALSGVDSSRGWLTLFSSGKDLGWQQDDKKLSDDSILAYTPVYACSTLAASDVGKICLRLMQQDTDGIWSETTSPAFSPVLRKPNHYQTRQQFIECWVLSKLLRGNAYILKVRDARKVVVALYVLDPDRVTPLVAPDGSVYYQLQQDELSKVPFGYEGIPASEIIHDRMECPFHPLVGVSPLFAAYLPAAQGLRIQKNSERFFRNMSRPSGVLTAPGEISTETAKRIKDAWEENYSGGNLGRVAVVGDDLKYIAMTVSAEDAQLVEQLKLSAEQICSAFHIPAYMVGAGQAPSYDNVEALNQQYYSQCLQKLFNAIEDLLDDGLNLQAVGYRTEFDLDDLLRMDSTAKAEAWGSLVKNAIAAPNEARRKFDLKPVKGGESPLAQQQNYSLSALAKRDAKADPFATTAPPAAPPSSGDGSPPQKSADPNDLHEAGEYFAKALA